MRLSLHRLGLDYQIEGRPDLGSWDANTKYKARFILEMLEANPGRNLVWLDADAMVRQYPALFNDLSIGDLAVHFRKWTPRAGAHAAKPVTELLSGTMFFRNNRRVRSLVKAWIKANDENLQEWEQRTLQRVLGKRFGKWRVEVSELPPTYCQIFDTMADAGEPVIEHFQASREAKRKNGNG